MKAQIVKKILLFSAIFVVILTLYTYRFSSSKNDIDMRYQLVLLNEIEQLTMMEGHSDETIKNTIDELKENLSNVSNKQVIENQSLIIFGYLILSLGYMLIVFLYIYYKMLAPFQKMEYYADQIAKGNMDITLNYERTNFFGAFTWAFDHMRKEIQYARKKEKDAIKENQTIIAALSHDIRTPIASIRAYGEALEAGLDEDYEQREQYLNVILRKCDEVTKLCDDLLTHSLSQLEELKINRHRIQVSEHLDHMFQDLNYPFLSIHHPFPQAVADIDEKRLAQVIENLLNNARKYAANTKIDVWAEIKDQSYLLHIHDHGSGIPDEDMPFIFQKFYRGHNVEDKPGSGLGLYIVRYIMNKMDGDITLKNRNGLEVILVFPIL